MIHNLMRIGCPIEPMVASVASYGSGNVGTPPSTRAPYLIVHSTHDNIVVYGYDAGRKPTCQCDGGYSLGSGDVTFSTGDCIDRMELNGEMLAATIVNARTGSHEHA